MRSSQCHAGITAAYNCIHTNYFFMNTALCLVFLWVCLGLLAFLYHGGLTDCAPAPHFHLTFLPLHTGIPGPVFNPPGLHKLRRKPSTIITARMLLRRRTCSSPPAKEATHTHTHTQFFAHETLNIKTMK